MTRRIVVSGMLALVAAGAVAAALVLGLGSSSSEPQPVPSALEPGEPVAAETTLSPPIHRLGDLVTARLELTIDPAFVDPDRITVRAQFAPYEPASEVQISSHRVGAQAVQVLSYELQCAVRECVSERSDMIVELPRAVVSFVRRDTGLGVDMFTDWPAATIVARTGNRARAVPAEATLGEPPPVSYAVNPDVLRGLAMGLAALLVALVAVWAQRTLTPRLRRRTRQEPAAVEPTGLSAAIEGLRIAGQEGPDAERLALEELACELESTNGRALAPLGRQLAPTARRLAWSAERPGRDELEALLAAARDIAMRSERGDRP